MKMQDHVEFWLWVIGLWWLFVHICTGLVLLFHGGDDDEKTVERP